MVDQDKTSQEIDELVSDLSKLLELSQDAANRLKQDIPGEHFPTAYELSKTIDKLRTMLKSLESPSDETQLLDLNDISMLQARNIISSGDSFIGR